MHTLGRVTHVVCSEVVQSPRYLNLLFGVEKGVGKLLPLSEGALDDLKARNIAKVVADRLVWVS